MARRVDNQPRVFKGHGTQERLCVLRPKNNFGKHSASHKFDASGSDRKLDQPTVSELVEIRSFRLDASLAQQRSRKQAIDGSRINQKISRYRGAPGKNRFDRSRDVGDTHEPYLFPGT